MNLKEAWNLPDRMWFDHGAVEVDLSGLSAEDLEAERARIKAIFADPVRWWVRWWREYDENLAAREGLLSV